ncbi:MAG: hypothetical protein KY475_01930 [Planctomycetes bacterium]|nr:hypothetical protein [Planctomycetota bacterium]
MLLVATTGVPLWTAEPDRSIEALPSGKRWTVHVYRDLLPFWTSAAAVGEPEGAFPTFRYDDGAVVDPTRPLRDEYRRLGASHPWITNRLDRKYVRMLSRQTYLYGVGYHLTGDPRLLALAKAGVDEIFATAMESDGSFASWFERGQGQPGPEFRTSQDLSYALLGPSFYYYLTRDEDVLRRILKAKRYIFQAYGDPERPGRLRWINADFVDPPDEHRRSQQELVALLDQVNAYMLLLTPILPERTREEWRRDLIALAEKIRDDYYSEDLNVFWGRIDAPEHRQLGGHHVDFGHTIKSFWMLYLIGQHFDRQDLVEFARPRAIRVLEEAYLPEMKAWGEKKLQDGAIQHNRVWWIYAELDQMAATLMLDETLRDEMASYLAPTYDYWFSELVDHEHGEVWHMIDAQTGEREFPKVHLWKNGFHSFEHALVGYITGQAARGRPVELYYAFKNGPADTEIQPYYYRAEARQVQREEHVGQNRQARWRVVFNNVR